MRHHRKLALTREIVLGEWFMKRNAGIVEFDGASYPRGKTEKIHFRGARYFDVFLVNGTGFQSLTCESRGGQASATKPPLCGVSLRKQLHLHAGKGEAVRKFGLSCFQKARGAHREEGHSLP